MLSSVRGLLAPQKEDTVSVKSVTPSAVNALAPLASAKAYGGGGLRRPPAGAATGTRLVAQRAVTLGPDGLSDALRSAKLTVGDVLGLRAAFLNASAPLSFLQVLSMLPPKVAQKIIASRNEALQKMLLAWGVSLREQAALDKKAQLRRNKASQELKGFAQAQQMRQWGEARALRAAQAAAAQVQGPLGSVPPTEPAAASRFDRRVTPAAVLSGENRPLMEALAVPMPIGVSLLGATLRLRSQVA